MVSFNLCLFIFNWSDIIKPNNIMNILKLSFILITAGLAVMFLLGVLFRRKNKFYKKYLHFGYRFIG